MEKNKKLKILITSGPTWVPIDTVRVITTVFGGKLGLEIAKQANKFGHSVTLLQGPGRIIVKSKKIKVIHFKYYDELLKLLVGLLKRKKFDVVIHSAAVADYEPIHKFNGKISSEKKTLVIQLKQTIKIVDLIKQISPKVFLVKFKLEINKSRNELINIAYHSMKKSRANLMVANDFKTFSSQHKAYIIDNNKKILSYNGKEDIAKNLILTIQKSFN